MQETSLSGGLYPKNLDKAMEEIEAIRGSNPTLWFVLRGVLKKLESEWEEEAIPSERLDLLDRVLRPRLEILMTLQGESLLNLREELEALVTAYISIYGGQSPG